MRVTEDVVRLIARAARERSGGVFHLDHVLPTKSCPVYVDGRTWTLSWTGGDGARAAAAYYAGVIAELCDRRGEKLPEIAQEVIDEVQDRHATSIVDGRTDAALWIAGEPASVR